MAQHSGQQKSPDRLWLATFILLAWIALLAFGCIATPEQIRGLADLLTALSRVLAALTQRRLP